VEHVRGMGGVFFRAADPKALLDWYRTHLGVEPAADFEGHVFRWSEDPAATEGTTTWALFPTDTSYFGEGRQASMVNYRVLDLDRMLDQLRGAGVEVIDRVEDSEFGRFGWAVDPEGNRFELWQPAPGL
jgi:predicted enzyme related to lactoylglutathione lyase